MSRIGRIFLTGLLAALPLMLTIFVTGWLLSLINQYLGPGSAFGRFLSSLGFGAGASELTPYLIGLALIIAGIYALGLLVHSRVGTWAAALFDRLIRVNLTGTFHTLRAALPHLRAAGGGAIVTMAGTTALRPARGEGPYGAAKAGVIALTQEVALSQAPAIRANCVAPGYVATRLTAGVVTTPWLREHVEGRIPMGRVGQPDDLVGPVVFLCSGMSAYVTGATLAVDGGFLAV